MSYRDLPTNQKQEIKEVLSAFGFNQKDQDVYLGLLESGQTTLTPLSCKLNLPVTTVQSAIGRLVQKGVVGTTKRRSRHAYEALDPGVFKDMLKEQANGIAGILPLLRNLKTDENVKTRIRIFERDRVAEMFNESLKCKSKEVFEVVSAKDFQDVIGEKYHYSRRRKKEGVTLKSLRVRSTEIKKYNKNIDTSELRQSRFLPDDLNFKASFSFWDDTVAIFSTKSEGVHIMITSKSIREMYEQIFNLLWSVSAKMETLAEEDEKR